MGEQQFRVVTPEQYAAGYFIFLECGGRVVTVPCSYKYVRTLDNGTIVIHEPVLEDWHGKPDGQDGQIHPEAHRDVHPGQPKS